MVLFRREMVRGDVVKKSLAEQESALVLSMRTEVQLDNVFDERIKIEEWTSTDKLQDIEVYLPGYQVAFDNWLGIIDYTCTAVFFWNAQRKEMYQTYDTMGAAAIGLTREVSSHDPCHLLADVGGRYSGYHGSHDSRTVFQVRIPQLVRAEGPSHPYRHLIGQSLVVSYQPKGTYPRCAQ